MLACVVVLILSVSICHLIDRWDEKRNWNKFEKHVTDLERQRMELGRQIMRELKNDVQEHLK